MEHITRVYFEEELDAQMKQIITAEVGLLDFKRDHQGEYLDYSGNAVTAVTLLLNLNGASLCPNGLGQLVIRYIDIGL